MSEVGTMGIASRASLVVAVLLCSTACGGRDRVRSECSPGDVRACPTGSGSQTCEADGRWGACEGILLDSGEPFPDAGSDASTGGPDGGGGDDAGAGVDAGTTGDAGPAGDAGGPFACGPELTCEPTTHYCSEFFGGPAGVPPSYNCVPLPTGCTSPPSCECIAGSGGGCSCAERGGTITVTCAAP